MKNVVLIFSGLFLLNNSFAQVKIPHVAMSYSTQTVLFHPQPISTDAKELPFIVSKTNAGEQFGFLMKGTPVTSPFIELLDNTGKVIQTLTVLDLFGGKSTSSVKLVSSKVSGSLNQSENIYELSGSQGNATLSISTLATSLDAKNAPAKLIFKIALRNYTGNMASARTSVPYVGTFESKEKGFILSAARSGQSLAGSIFTPVEKITGANKKMVVTAKTVNAGEEKILLMMLIEGVNSKTEAESVVKEFVNNNPNDIVIVNTVDAQNAQPSDTVTYRIHCVNIGKGPVSDIIISNEVSTGTRYLEGSAAGDETAITFKRNDVPLPQIGEVKSISWKFSKSLDVGHEKKVAFKVVIQ